MFNKKTLQIPVNKNNLPDMYACAIFQIQTHTEHWSEKEHVSPILKSLLLHRGSCNNKSNHSKNKKATSKGCYIANHTYTNRYMRTRTHTHNAHAHTHHTHTHTTAPRTLHATTLSNSHNYISLKKYFTERMQVGGTCEFVTGGYMFCMKMKLLW